MTTRSDDEFVKHVQSRLSSTGFYQGAIDGKAGPMTLSALDRALPLPTFLERNDLPLTPVVPLSSRVKDDIPDSGDSKLVGVHVVLSELVKVVSLKCDVPFTVIEGLRTIERQRELVARGASKTMKSRHLTGHAVDLWPLDANSKPLPAGNKEREAVLWRELRKIADVVKSVAKEHGIMVEWGGDWGWDAPHFQLNRSMYP